MEIKTALLPDGSSWLATEDAERKAWEVWRKVARVVLERGEGVSVKRLASDVIIESVCANEAERISVSIAPTGECFDRSKFAAPELELF